MASFVFLQGRYGPSKRWFASIGMNLVEFGLGLSFRRYVGSAMMIRSIPRVCLIFEFRDGNEEVVLLLVGILVV